jgi:hypothetical protein
MDVVHRGDYLPSAFDAAVETHQRTIRAVDDGLEVH